MFDHFLKLAIKELNYNLYTWRFLIFLYTANLFSNPHELKLIALLQDHKVVIAELGTKIPHAWKEKINLKTNMWKNNNNFWLIQVFY